MMKLDDDIHAGVLALAHALVDASAGADKRAHWRLHRELSDYCDAMAANGRDHPFLWETLADFTSDPVTAIGLYQRALALADAAAMTDYQASICLVLAERHGEAGQHDQAWTYAQRADIHAARSDDLDLRLQVNQFLLAHAD